MATEKAVANGSSTAGEMPYAPFTIVGGVWLLFVCMACLLALVLSVTEITRGDVEDAPMAFALLETIGAISSGWTWSKKYREWRRVERQAHRELNA